MGKNTKESQLIMESKIKKKKKKIGIPLNQIICDHNVRAMRRFSDNSIDSILTDPPYGLEFMGKEWDKLGAKVGNTTERWSKEGLPSIPSGRVCYGKSVKSMQQWHYKWAKECLRIAKPGAFMFVFGGTRTFHRLTCAIEDAGWQIRDCLMWLYGSGFPKSLDISKAIDKAKGKRRKVVGTKRGVRGADGTGSEKNMPGKATGIKQVGIDIDITIPASKLAKLWDGYGTALKPAWEPIIVAMKPVDGNFAKNAEKYGVAGLNIDGGRIGIDLANEDRAKGKNTIQKTSGISFKGNKQESQCTPLYNLEKGRWPANVILDEEAAKILDKQEDASRFFYIAKASRSERNAGCGGMALGEPPASARSKPAKGRQSALGKPRQNFHPTVKPLQLMQYLCMLLKMPSKDQIILDPFAGSGTTCIACKELGINYIGIDKDKDYCEIARKRLEAVKPNLFENLPKKKSKKTKARESFGLCE